MLRLVQTGNGEEFFELNRNELEAVSASKNHTRGFDGSKDPSDGKIFPQASSRRCPVEVTWKVSYLSHLNPNSDALFQKLKELGSTKFNPAKENIWYEGERELGHITQENLLRKMTEKSTSRALPDKQFIESDNSHRSVCKKRWDSQIKAIKAQKRHEHWKPLWATDAQPV